MAIKTFPITLERIETITPNVRHFVFRTTDKQPFVFTPGQFITIHFIAGDKKYKRSYSIASIPATTATSQYQCEDIEFAASFVPHGPGSELLFHLEPGQTLEASGPFGRLVLHDEHPKRYILVATGTGVTPYRSMLPQLRQCLSAAGLDLEIILLLGVQTRADLLYGADFIHMAEHYPQFHFRAQYSREPTLTDPKPWEHQGYVQNTFPELHLNPEKDVIYLCGNPGMIDNAFAQLKALGFSSQTVRREKYISSPATASA